MEEELKKALHNEKNEVLLKYSNKKIKEIKNKVIEDLPIYAKEKSLLKKKLLNYKFIMNLDELYEGNYIRWINMEKEELFLTIGGFLVEIQFSEEGVKILLKGLNQNIFSIYFDKCILFQKLRNQEIILLKALDHINS